MLLEPPAVLSTLSNAAICAMLSSVAWLPLSASWRDAAARRRRRSAAIAATAGTVLLAIAARVLFGPGAPLTPHLAAWVWLAGFAAATLGIVGVASAVSRWVYGAGWWLHAEGDTAADRRRWTLVPLVVSAFCAVVLGWGYNLLAVAAVAAAEVAAR
ncbi:hypothetical protein [Phenylobacterium sp.]|uniref:hypothetical protein n=1 Tax=Phenylobacterium sp. TaxID=1871053 RepID=UPI0035AF0E5F